MQAPVRGADATVDVDRLQDSLGRVATFGDEVPLYFYSHLFLTHPHLRVMFPAAMAAQRDRLVGALVQVVGNIHRVDAVVPHLEQLARDHRKYGVQAAHYPAFGAALLATLEHFLCDRWSPELAADWTTAYGVVSSIMTTAAADAEAETPAWYDVEVTGHEQRAPGVAVLTVRPDRRIDIRAGQSLAVQTPLVPRLWRYFSPANAPRHDGTLELHVRSVDGGWVSPVLVHSVGKGDSLRLGPPVGVGLLLDRESSAGIVMLAGGTGLAPLRAVLEQLQVEGAQRPVCLYVGARSEAELYDLPRLRQMQDSNPWLTVVPVVTRGSTPGGETGEVADVAVRRHHWRDHEVYLCGGPDMVARSLETLAQSGIDPERVRREAFSLNGHESGHDPR